MDTKTLSTTDLINQWEFHIKTQNFEKAATMKKAIEKCFDSINQDTQLLTNYLVTNYSHYLLNEQFDEAEKVLHNLESQDLEWDDQLEYRFYLAKGTHFAFFNSKFDEALRNFKLAESMLGTLTCEINQAEFDYKIATYYYHVSKPILSIQHITKALDVYKDFSEYTRKRASCENILGVNSIEMKQYEQAEEHLHAALDFAAKTNNSKFKAEILHNLGLLYSKQNMTHAALHWLNQNILIDDLHVLTSFLLSKENFKLGKTDEAQHWLNKGMEICEKIGDQEYLTRFMLLNAYFLETNSNSFVNIYIKGIEYFQNEKMWEHVEEYASQLANYYRGQERFKEASDFYVLALDAQKNIFKLE